MAEVFSVSRNGVQRVKAFARNALIKSGINGHRRAVPHSVT